VHSILKLIWNAHIIMKPRHNTCKTGPIFHCFSDNMRWCCKHQLKKKHRLQMWFKLFQTCNHQYIYSKVVCNVFALDPQSPNITKNVLLQDEKIIPCRREQLRRKRLYTAVYHVIKWSDASHAGVVFTIVSFVFMYVHFWISFSYRLQFWADITRCERARSEA